MTVYITIEGLEETIRQTIPNCTKVIGLKPHKPAFLQLYDVDFREDFIAVPHPKWEREMQEAFSIMVHETSINVLVTHNTHNAYAKDWIERAFWNYEIAMTAPLVQEIPKKGTYALICGAGPSLKNYRWNSNAQVFAPWSAVRKLRNYPDIIGHCDAKKPDYAEVTRPKQGILFTPSVSTEFIKEFNDYTPQKYLYYNRGSFPDVLFADKRNVPDHDSIVGTVTDLLILAALYIGHTRIKLVGVDLCYSTLEEIEDRYPHSNIAECRNIEGDKVWSNDVFLLYKQGIEKHVSRYPNVTFLNASKVGLPLDGYTYEE